MKKINKLIAVLICATFLIPSLTYNVQAIEVSQQYIHQNRSYRQLNPVGLVIHDTDSIGGTAQNNHDYFNRVYVAASAHYFIDWDKLIQCIPESEQAWHAGPTANKRYLSIEMCMPRNNNVQQFNSMYNKTIELAADICRRYGWSAKNIYSHYYCSVTYNETDHEDPIEFLKSYGLSWNQMVNDIQNKINSNNITQNDVNRAANYLGSNTKKVQYILNCFGYNLSVDGKCGMHTTKCISDLQSKLGIHQDCLFGPKTINMAINKLGIAEKGCTNRNINRLIQYILNVKPEDGWYGNVTSNKVIEFQKQHNIRQDGRVGKKTFNAMIL